MLSLFVRAPGYDFGCHRFANSERLPQRTNLHGKVRMMQKTGTSNILRVKIGGQAGQGVKTSGLLLAKLSTRSGYHIYNYIEYPSLIRVGHNVMQVNISEQEITAPSTKTDFLVALNQDTLDKHINEMTSGSGILYDTDDKLS